MVEESIGVYLLPHTCDKSMAELENEVYDAASDKTIRELLDWPHQVPQTTSYKQSLKILFRLWLVKILSTRHPTQLIPMRCSSIPSSDSKPHQSYGGSRILIWSGRWKPTVHPNVFENYAVHALRLLKPESGEP